MNVVADIILVDDRLLIVPSEKRNTVSRIEQDSAANGSQPGRSETNRKSLHSLLNPSRPASVEYDFCPLRGEDLLRKDDSEAYHDYAVTLVERRIQELATPEGGRRKCYIQSVRRKVVVPNRRYSWQLFELLTDGVPVEAVVLDVDLDEACKIDRQVAQTLRDVWVITAFERPVPA